ncbi:sensor histidine kinase [Nocardioides sp. AX2bis]|uniref:sensor histidine kinase n=1 Tax=Nocardioides sp. AX2bis TaxID=2653157 RepID=UPI0012F23B82|nr:ATP-binding protein [Nocardioides sp. AX2bis]VXB43541.1 putative Histidine kinase [Nocardioides sp. AX2bis]
MPSKGRRSWSVAIALAAAAVAMAVYAGVDPEGMTATACYMLVVVGASVGAWIGASRAPRGHRVVPYLIALGVSLTSMGEVLWFALDLMGARTDVSVADPFFFASYVALCAALWVVLARGSGRGGARVDLDFTIDLLTIVAVSVLLFWSFSLQSIAADSSLSLLARVVAIAYPLADAILLALVVRVLVSRRARASLGIPLLTGVCLWLVADITYALGFDGDTATTLTGLAWMTATVFLALAAGWSAEPPTDTAGPPAFRSSAAQLTVALGPLAVPPLLELARDLRGEPDRLLQLLVGTAVLIALAVVRTARLIRSEERTRRQLEAARDAALEASRAKSMFLANMSHELRTPLTAVLGMGEILADTQLDEFQAGLLERMNRSGTRLGALVERTLDFSRIEAGRVELETQVFDVHAMAADVAELYEPRAARAAIDFEWQVDPAVPRLVVGDPGRLFQVVTNLLDNALKFTHEGRVGLTLRVATLQETGEEGPREVLELVVWDTGIGIAEADQESVFQSFSQVDDSMTRRYDGTGLGLAICRELTGLMGGTVTLYSTLGHGSTFIARIPSERPADDAPPEQPAPEQPAPDPANRPSHASVS